MVKHRYIVSGKDMYGRTYYGLVIACGYDNAREVFKGCTGYIPTIVILYGQAHKDAIPFGTLLNMESIWDKVERR